ncbi:MAG: PDDEXK nuclease domain-containing protein [Desulfobacterales bacterium]|nr:PDDEXK nuclease domain-containing protein [Desulfobacterales bacterium]
MEKGKDLSARRWYMEQTLVNGWSRNILAMQITARAHARHGKAVSNFDTLLPSPQSDLAQQALKDPYIFDFLTLDEPFHERELETQLVRHLERFLLELGQGFAFVGRQYKLNNGDQFGF